MYGYGYGSRGGQKNRSLPLASPRLDEDELGMAALLRRSHGQPEPLAATGGRRQSAPARRASGQALAAAVVAGRQRRRRRHGHAALAPASSWRPAVQLGGWEQLPLLVALLVALVAARVQGVLQILLLLVLLGLLLVVVAVASHVLVTASAAVLALRVLLLASGGGGILRGLGCGGADNGGDRVLDQGLEVTANGDAISWMEKDLY